MEGQQEEQPMQEEEEEQQEDEHMKQAVNAIDGAKRLLSRTEATFRCRVECVLCDLPIDNMRDVKKNTCMFTKCGCLVHKTCLLDRSVENNRIYWCPKQPHSDHTPSAYEQAHPQRYVLPQLPEAYYRCTEDITNFTRNKARIDDMLATAITHINQINTSTSTE
jgi:hypothetical protein